MVWYALLVSDELITSGVLRGPSHLDVVGAISFGGRRLRRAGHPFQGSAISLCIARKCSPSGLADGRDRAPVPVVRNATVVVPATAKARAPISKIILGICHLPHCGGELAWRISQGAVPEVTGNCLAAIVLNSRIALRQWSSRGQARRPRQNSRPNLAAHYCVQIGHGVAPPACARPRAHQLATGKTW
jgi:hypothetical protein